MGADFDLPLRAEYTAVEPQQISRSFVAIDQPNVNIVDIKPVAENVIRGEVSSAPLNPPVNKSFVIRLQEFAGKAAMVKLTLPREIKTASIVSITEDKILGDVDSIAPLIVKIKPFQTLTVRIEIK